MQHDVMTAAAQTEAVQTEAVQTLADLARHGADQFADNIAIIDRKRTLTFTELEQQSRELANTLAASGVNKGDRVGILLGRSIEALVSALAIMRLGACYVPLDPSAPAERVQAIAKFCNMTTVVTDSRRIAKLGDLAQGLLTLRWDEAEDWRKAPPVDFTDRQPKRDEIAYILHTSGSSGTPKGVPLSHHNALAFVKMTREFFQIVSTDRLTGHAPLHFDLSVFDIYAAWLSGAAVVIIPEHFAAFPKKLSGAVATYGITIWNSVVSTLALAEQGGDLVGHDTSTLRLVLFCGEMMPLPLLRSLREKIPSATFYNMYGQTEANSSTYYRVAIVPDDDEWQLPIGQAFPGFEVFAISDQGSVVQPGESGELYVAAETVGCGYLNAPEQTAARYVADPRNPNSKGLVYRTGDRVRRDADGNYVYLGRTDNMVKTRGYRVELDEVELAITTANGIRRAAVVAVSDDRVGNRLVAFALSGSETHVDPEVVLAACRRSLPAYMVPERLEICGELPKTSSGKVDRQRLTLLARELLASKEKT